VIIDSSAIIAIVSGEPDARRLLGAMMTSHSALIAAPTLVECYAVAHRAANDRMAIAVSELLQEFGVEVISFDEEQARIAAEAYARYGRGSGHPAKLNLGDTFAYALAIHRKEPLLYVGEDFQLTDVRSA
jgi:ribonuclease VapC